MELSVPSDREAQTTSIREFKARLGTDAESSAGPGFEARRRIMPTATLKQIQTKNDLPAATREVMIGLLQQSTIEAVDLKIQAKLAHWNVKGPSFIALHELFDRAANDIGVFTDDLAERLVQLGGLVEGNVQTVGSRTTLPAYSMSISDGRDHVEAFSSALSSFGTTIRKSIDLASKAGDQGTADLFTEVSRGIDKLLWFVEAHNQ
jgi:starvation-inducible DNA-binding protein